MIWGQDNSAGEKDFEFFQVIDDLRPRHFCRRNKLWIFSVFDDLRPRQFSRRKRLWIFPDYWWFAAKTNLQVKKSLKFSRLLMICVSENSAGEKVLEYFQVIADLRLRQFCRWKSLWIFSGYRWSADKTNLQAKSLWMFSDIDDLRPRQFCTRKKSLNISRLLMICGPDNFVGETIFEFFRLLMICGQNDFAGEKTLNISRLLMIWGQDNSAGEKDFEYFQVVDDFRPRYFCRRNNLWIFPSCWWFAAKTILQVKKSLNVFGILMICG